MRSGMKLFIVTILFISVFNGCSDNQGVAIQNVATSFDNKAPSKRQELCDRQNKGIECHLYAKWCERYDTGDAQKYFIKGCNLGYTNSCKYITEESKKEIVEVSNNKSKWGFTGLSDYDMKNFEKSKYTPETIQHECKGFFKSEQILHKNPYSLIGSCGYIIIKVANQTSRNTAFGHYTRPFAKRPFYDKPILFTLPYNDSDISYPLGVSGYFKVNGVDQVTLVNGSTASALNVTRIIKR